MTHLTPDQLSALLDGALEARARAAAERHLEACERCRAELASLASQDELVASALDHDPGEAYFEGFAGRVSERIRREGAAARRGERPAGFLGWLSTPRGLALAGSVAAVIVVAGLVLVQSRERMGADLRNPELAARERQVAPAPSGSGNEATPAPARPRPPGPAMAAPPSEDRVAEEPADHPTPRAPKGEQRSAKAAGRSTQAPQRGQEAPAVGAAQGDAGGGQVPERLEEREADHTQQGQSRAHMVPLRPDASGEQVPARPQAAAGLAQPQAQAPAPPAQGPVTATRSFAKALPDLKSQGSAEKGGARQDRKELATQAQPPMDGLRAGVVGGQSQTAQTQNGAAGEGAAFGSGKICGVVRDPRGHPVAGAEVAVTESGQSARTGVDGRFCLDAAEGERSLTILCLGYKQAHRAVAVGAAAAPLEITLEPVEITVGAARTLLGATSSTLARGTSWPETLRVRAATAESLSAHAERSGEAARYDLAAGAWERLAVTSAGWPRGEARWRSAEARFRAWKAEPTAVRRAAAMTAARADGLSSAAGPRGEQLRAWLAELTR
jgi:hypothetical protein